MQESNNNTDIPPYGQWQWQSNKNPWLKGQEKEWTSYSREENELIEEAFYEQKNEVDIGDYIISIQHWVQKKKGAVVSQRPIRRIKADDEEEMKWREERYFDTELPKTANNIFGSVDDLRKFITQRNYDGMELWEHLQYIAEEQNLEFLNQHEAPLLRIFIIEEAIKRGAPQEQLISLILLFAQEFASLEEFYGQIMKAYTMDTFLYRNLNQYLRNEDWIALDSMTPYIFWLFIGIERLQEKAKMDELMKNNSKDGKFMSLYRGTRMDQDSLEMYSLEKFRNFSWYSVTSTTTNQKIAQRFMGVGKEDDGKIPVVFKIKVPISTEGSNAFYLNVKPFSSFKGEDEVIFAPGCIFKIESVVSRRQGQKKFSEINLILITNTDGFARSGLLMPGKMQKTPEKGLFEDLSGSMISEHLRHFAGNKLMKEIEFKDCTFSEKCFEILVTQVFPAMPNLQKLKFNLCTIQDAKGFFSETILRPQFPFSRIQEIEIIEKNEVFKTLLAVKNGNLNYWGSLTSLTLDFMNSKKTEMTDKDYTDRKKTTDEDISNLCLHALRHLTQLTSFDLNFSMLSEITDEGLKVLFTEGLWHLVQLKSLKLSINGSEKITDKAVNFIYFEGLPRLKKLESLALTFRYCKEITGQVKNQNCQHESLPQLTSLALDFSSCAEITEQGVDLYSQIVPNPNQLKKLELSFFKSLTDEGLENLYNQAFQHLNELISLNLDLSSCSEITDKGISFLCSNKIKPLKYLEEISIDLYGLEKITKEKVERLRNLLALYPKYSDLWLTSNEKPKECLDKSVDEIDLYGLSNWIFERIIEPMEENDENDLPELYSLGFPTFETITYEIINQEFDDFLSVESEALKVNFEGRFYSERDIPITDAFEYIVLKKFHHLSHVKYLYLNFKRTEVTDKNIELLASEGLKNFPRLLLLQINFSECRRITDKSVEHLVTTGFRQIPQLKYLKLNFKESLVSDEGVGILVYQGIKQLQELRHLELILPQNGFSDYADYPDRLIDLGFKFIEMSPENEESFECKDGEYQEDEEEEVDLEKNIGC